jgi:hypothetical protein
MAGSLLRNFGKLGRDHFAGPTPRCPKVDQNRQGRMADKRLKRQVRRYIYGLRQRGNLIVALPAAKCLFQRLVPETIALSAMRAHQERAAWI